jgi:hypothetical protein
MKLQKVIAKKLEKNKFLIVILKVTDENTRIRSLSLIRSRIRMQIR